MLYHYAPLEHLSLQILNNCLQVKQVGTKDSMAFPIGGGPAGPGPHPSAGTVSVIVSITTMRLTICE